MVLTNDSLLIPNIPEGLTPQIISKSYSLVMDSTYIVSGYFYAIGGEKYLTIGVFGYDEDIVPISIQDTTFDIEDKDTKIWTKNIIDNVRVYEVPAPLKLTLGGISFATNDFQLQENAEKILQKVVGVFDGNNNISIVINGYTDSVGDETSNLNLSIKRADAVKKWLERNGVNTQIETRGYGEQKPITSNDTESGRAQNRRVEILLFEKGR